MHSLICSLSPSVPCRPALMSQKWFSRSTSPIYASKSTPTCWTLASSGRKSQQGHSTGSPAPHSASSFSRSQTEVMQERCRMSPETQVGCPNATIVHVFHASKDCPHYYSYPYICCYSDGSLHATLLIWSSTVKKNIHIYGLGGLKSIWGGGWKWYDYYTDDA